MFWCFLIRLIVVVIMVRVFRLRKLNFIMLVFLVFLYWNCVIGMLEEGFLYKGIYLMRGWFVIMILVVCVEVWWYWFLSFFVIWKYLFVSELFFNIVCRVLFLRVVFRFFVLFICFVSLLIIGNGVCIICFMFWIVVFVCRELKVMICVIVFLLYFWCIYLIIWGCCFW